MEITFSDGKLQKLCEQENVANKQLGAPCARKLRSRLADLMAATTLKDLVTGNPHPLKGDRAGQFSITLHGGKRLVFKPDDDPIPLTAEEAIDWPNVTRVCIIFIGDYHD